VKRIEYRTYISEIKKVKREVICYYCWTTFYQRDEVLSYRYHRR